MESVEAAENGSRQAVSGTGMRSMSDSLMAFQPAIDEPSNIWPSEKNSSSTSSRSNVTCCHLPFGSVKRRSTYFTSLSSMNLRTSLPVFIAISQSPVCRCIVVIARGGQRRAKAELDRVVAGFAGTDADDVFDIGDENLAVADAPGLGCLADGVNGGFDPVVAEHHFDFHLGQKVDDIFGAA